MSYPPTSLPARTDTSPATPNSHATDHTDERNAINDIVTELGTAPHGAATDLTARLTALDSTVAAKLAAASNLSDLANAATARTNLGLGTAATVADSTLVHLAGTEVLTGAKTLNALTLGGDMAGGGFNVSGLRTVAVSGLSGSGGLVTLITGSPTYTTTSGLNGLIMNPVVTVADGSNANVVGLQFKPTVQNVSTGTYGTVQAVLAQVGLGTAPTITTAKGIEAIFSFAGAATITTATLFRGEVKNLALVGGTLTTCIGLDLKSLAGSTVWGLQVGAYNSYHQGAFTLGGTTAGTWLLHVQGGNAATNGIGIDVSTTAPTVPASSASGVISVYKGATNWYLLITFQDSTTTRYRYMQLNGTTATWTHATTLPT